MIDVGQTFAQRELCNCANCAWCLVSVNSPILLKNFRATNGTCENSASSVKQPPPPEGLLDEAGCHTYFSRFHCLLG